MPITSGLVFHGRVTQLGTGSQTNPPTADAVNAAIQAALTAQWPGTWESKLLELAPPPPSSTAPAT